jgi:hypothetical protein
MSRTGDPHVSAVNRRKGKLEIIKELVDDFLQLKILEDHGGSAPNSCVEAGIPWQWIVKIALRRPELFGGRLS